MVNIYLTILRILRGSSRPAPGGLLHDHWNTIRLAGHFTTSVIVYQLFALSYVDQKTRWPWRDPKTGIIHVPPAPALEPQKVATDFRMIAKQVRGTPREPAPYCINLRLGRTCTADGVGNMDYPATHLIQGLIGACADGTAICHNGNVSPASQATHDAAGCSHGTAAESTMFAKFATNLLIAWMVWVCFRGFMRNRRVAA